MADKGKGGHLVSKSSYKDFQIRAEFWADHTTNSGIFFRISDPKTIGSKSAYEANIYDQRLEPEYGTGAIVNSRRAQDRLRVAVKIPLMVSSVEPRLAGENPRALEH